MTTTHMYQGLEGSKNSSRVLRPPGGASSNIFGCDSVPEYRKDVPNEQSTPEAEGEAGRPAGVCNPKDTATSHTRLFGGDEDPSNQSCQSPTVPADVSAPAGVSSGSTKKKNQVSSQDEENSPSTGITACRKRIFKNEGRDEEEEDEEERKKREEEERQKQEEERRRMRSIAKPPRGAYNPITGEDYSDQILNWNRREVKKEVPKSAPQAHVRQPPGGASSGLW